MLKIYTVDFTKDKIANSITHSPLNAEVIIFCLYFRLVRATQSAALAISTTGCGEERTSMTDIFSQIRRGMVLLDTHLGPPKACVRYNFLPIWTNLAKSNQSNYWVDFRFQAQVNLLFHPTEIVRGFRTTVHVGNVRQTAGELTIHRVLFSYW